MLWCAVVCCVAPVWHQFVDAPGIPYTVAASRARDATNLGISGHLATIATSEENVCVSMLTNCDRAWLSGSRTSSSPSATWWVVCPVPHPLSRHSL